MNNIKKITFITSGLIIIFFAYVLSSTQNVSTQEDFIQSNCSHIVVTNVVKKNNLNEPFRCKVKEYKKGESILYLVSIDHDMTPSQMLNTFSSWNGLVDESGTLFAEPGLSFSITESNSPELPAACFGHYLKFRSSHNAYDGIVEVAENSYKWKFTFDDLSFRGSTGMNPDFGGWQCNLTGTIISNIDGSEEEILIEKIDFPEFSSCKEYFSKRFMTENDLTYSFYQDDCCSHLKFASDGGYLPSNINANICE